jgi:hypothetical protein
MKKISILCLALLLAACGGSTDSSPDRTVLLGTVTSQHSSAKIASTTAGERRAYDFLWSAGKLTGTAKTTALSSFQLSAPEVRLQDISLTFDKDGLPGQLYRLYQASFGRTPDVAGFGYWKDVLETKGGAISQVARDFLGSAESTALYGANSNNALFIERLYQNVLHRKPDSGGTAYWLDILKSGEQRTNVLLAFADSTENKAATAAAAAAGMAFAEPGMSYIPVSNATGLPDVPVGIFFEVDGATSTDANGDALRYSWSMTKKPAGSTAAFTNASDVKPKIALDKAGVYELTLWTSDASSQSYSPATLTVTAHDVVFDSGTYTCSTLDAAKAQLLYWNGHTYLDRDKDGIACNPLDIAYEMSPSVPVIADTHAYTCSTISHPTAILLYLQGHSYLDRDHDGKPCETTDINLENPVYTPPTPSSPSTGMCWVKGYRRSNGTYVNGYYRHC